MGNSASRREIDAAGVQLAGKLLELMKIGVDAGEDPDDLAHDVVTFGVWFIRFHRTDPYGLGVGFWGTQRMLTACRKELIARGTTHHNAQQMSQAIIRRM